MLKVKVEYDNYSDYGNARFTVDTDVFTDDKAKEHLEFFSWSYDKKERPIVEICKKISARLWQEAFEDWNTEGYKSVMDDLEGYPRLDGKDGIELTYCDAGFIEEDDITVEVEEI